MKFVQASIKVGSLVAFLAAIPLGQAQAAIRLQAVDYPQGAVTLEGFVAYDDAVTTTRPGVLVFPQFKGVSEHEKDAAKRLAELGYIAFVGDIYGKGIFHEDRKEAGDAASKYANDRPLLRARVTAALDEIRKNPLVDSGRIAAIGYCFGGMAALELGREGADVVGLVTFHGDLATPTPEDAKNIKGRVLVLHGADDPIVPPAMVAAFEQEMRDAKVDWQLVSYGGAVHAFTEPNDPRGSRQSVAYNENADKRSWIAMKDFLHEIFSRPTRATPTEPIERRDNP
jgi:dienelactone hydrolase